MNSEFYIEQEMVRCGAACTKPATHRVMRVGKIDYGLYCLLHAKKKVHDLERSQAILAARDTEVTEK